MKLQVDLRALDLRDGQWQITGDIFTPGVPSEAQELIDAALAYLKARAHMAHIRAVLDDKKVTTRTTAKTTTDFTEARREAGRALEHLSKVGEAYRRNTEGA